MKSLILLLFIIKSCVCVIQFSERPRNFSIELLYFTQNEMNGHVVISPFGIWSLLTSISAGAGGNSKLQLQNVLRLPTNKTSVFNGYENLTKTVLDLRTDDVKILSNNFIFIDKDFAVKPSFKEIQASYFQSKILYIDFQNSGLAAQSANSIIQGTGISGGTDATNMFTSNDFAQSRMVLSNVIKFKGLWTSPFNASDTRVEKFFDENNNKLGEVNMMYQRNPFSYSNIRSLGSLVAEIPYGPNKKYSMLIILPYPKIKVTDVYKKLSIITLVDIFSRLQKDDEEFGLGKLDLYLPRFKISTNVILNRPLNTMGLKDIFNEMCANFEHITENSIYVSKIVHKADIEVTEFGTEASGATYADFSHRMSTPQFKVNRPFIYFVMQRSTATVLFGGVYSRPSLF